MPGVACKCQWTIGSGIGLLRRKHRSFCVCARPMGDCATVPVTPSPIGWAHTQNNPFMKPEPGSMVTDCQSDSQDGTNKHQRDLKRSTHAFLYENTFEMPANFVRDSTQLSGAISFNNITTKDGIPPYLYNHALIFIFVWYDFPRVHT